jgi:hypothetical protein
MKHNQRLLFYILLNVVVSAVTILVVLYFWDRAHPSPLLPNYPTSVAALPQVTQPAATAPTSNPSATQPPAQATLPGNQQDRLITIDNVFGAGSLPDEFVLLKRVGDGELSLTGWKLDDGSGHSYTFPALTLYKNGAVQVHTTTGVDSVVDLYWGRDAAVWSVGKNVTLTDTQGVVRATYRIP